MIRMSEVNIDVLMTTIHEQAKAITELNNEKKELIEEFLEIWKKIGQYLDLSNEASDYWDEIDNELKEGKLKNEEASHPYWERIREKYQDKIIKLKKENRKLIVEFLDDLDRESDHELMEKWEAKLSQIS